MTGFWWPGLLFVIGASVMARGVAEGRDWYSVPGGLWMIGLGLVFAFGFSWPLLLILIGVSMLFGKSWQDREHRHGRRVMPDETKAKNDEKRKHEDNYIIDPREAPDSGEYTVEDLLSDEKPKRT